MEQEYLKQNLDKARSVKNDEFYTRMSTIKDELPAYRDFLEGKIVYCNCDDPDKSKFVKYLVSEFDNFRLKKLIATCYVEGGKGRKMEYDGTNLLYSLLEGDGDFASSECLGLMDQSDVMITNVPFSLFRKYITTIYEHKKKFLIIGNMNAITYKEVYPLIMKNELWLGHSLHGIKCSFKVNDDYEGKNVFYENGVKYASVNNAIWFTNMDHGARHKVYPLTKEYKGHEEEYPKYLNVAGGIEVSKAVNIPKDYDGIFGVPISFLDKYNPAQFEIVGFRKGEDGKDVCYVKDGKEYCPYFRILMKNKRFRS